MPYVFCYTMFFLSFLLSDLCLSQSLSLLPIYCPLLAFSDTTWRLTIIPLPQSIINRHNTRINCYITGTGEGAALRARPEEAWTRDQNVKREEGRGKEGDHVDYASFESLIVCGFMCNKCQRTGYKMTEYHNMRLHLKHNRYSPPQAGRH
jgi:hypothetical protein